MKLKKIASLMLAGVMAISMLAGCSNNGSNDNKGEETATGITIEAVEAKLDKAVTDKVDFSADTALQTALQTAVKAAGDNAVNGVDANDIIKIADIKDTVTYLSTAPVDKKAVIVRTGVVEGIYNDAYIVNEIAKTLNNDLDNLPAASITSGDNDDEYYTYEYAGNLAIEKVTATNGTDVAYVFVYSVTRTPTEAKVEF